MATLTVSINSALGSTSKVLTFSAADATRIMNATPNWTQQQLNDFLAQCLKDHIGAMVVRRESVQPVPPAMT